MIIADSLLHSALKGQCAGTQRATCGVLV